MTSSIDSDQSPAGRSCPIVLPLREGIGQNGFMFGMQETEWIISKSSEIGFDLCGVVPASGLADPSRLDKWLSQGYAGTMRYLHDPRRADVMHVFPGARSAIVCALTYNTAHAASTEAASLAAGSELHGWISRYAWGDDYHVILGGKLDQLLVAMRGHFKCQFEVRPYVDTGPISERLAAQQAGLGWQAKNTCLINEKLGSWLFLGIILTSLELTPSQASQGAPADLCGNCQLCLEACPTGALVAPYVMDARRCISYLTIELRGPIPDDLRAPMGWQVFGCDICQDVCPWNRKAPVTSDPAFQPRQRLMAPELKWLLSLSQQDFNDVFSGTPVRRAKWRGLLRNACIAAGNLAGRYPDSTPDRLCLRRRLNELAQFPDPLISEHAAWALKRFAECD